MQTNLKHLNATSLKIYRVGGYVRDSLLGLVAHDCDYVVIGSTPDEMVTLGFIPVGKSFPVFLHPQTKAEYALARIEKKTASGHTGFAIYSSPDVTLEQDLSRRDLTINAIAEDSNGNLIDPYNGIADLHAKIIRHVSDAFIEDPLRILRVARFAAKLNFTVADETLHLLTTMAASGEVTTISRERIINELDKALDANKSNLFFEVLAGTNNLALLFPSLATLYKNKQLWHDSMNILAKPVDKTFKYLFLALMYFRLDLTKNYNELSNNKKITQQMLQFITLHRIKLLDYTDENILHAFKQLNIWRDKSNFSIISQYYLLYGQLINDKTITNKIQQITALVDALLQLEFKDLLANFDSSVLANKIKQRQLTIINNFKGNLR